MQVFLISYDISCDSDRNKVYRLLKKTCNHIQKSVFVFEGTEAVLRSIEESIMPKLGEEDSLLIMPCCADCFKKTKFYSKTTEDMVII